MKSAASTGQKTLEQKIKTTPIAVIGMASIFPQSHNLAEYWDLILNKIDAVSDVPASRWNSEDYYDPDPAAADKTYCKRGGFIPDIDFDPAEFGLPPNLLEATDVTQLLSLVVARECLEDAGYGDGREASRENIGVILGMVGIGSKLVIPLMARLQYPVWEKVLRSYGIAAEDTAAIIEKIKLAYPKWEENSFPGSIGNVIAGRIANRFNLGGTNCVVDAACASSLAAIRMAAGELIEGRADMMITGGVDLDNSIGAYLCFSKTPAFSKGEHVRTFDRDSDGMMVGEGIGMVMLKRLEDARRDGDRIYAVIKAIGTSSDGRYKSIYAPRPEGQSLALRRAYAEAGFPPATVGLVEAHGTGTTAGDPAEFQGMNAVFSEGNPLKQHIALGSVKSQIGHTKAAAGVASLIKASLALHHKVLPATINVKNPNPKLEIEKSPFYLNTEVRPWIRPAAHPRRAGVSSFGFGGTNFHVALEENESEHSGAYRLQTTAKLILVAAETPAALLDACRDWASKLAAPDAGAAFGELALQSTARPVPPEYARVGFAAAGPEEAVSRLKAAVEILNGQNTETYAEHPSGVYYSRRGVAAPGSLVALFPGQGSQYVDMGRELALNFPPVRQAFAEMDELFHRDSLPALSGRVYPVPVFDSARKDLQGETLTRTENAQPAIGALSAGLFRLLRQAGFSPDFCAGHSFGELTALWAAGVYSDADFFSLAKARGQAMAPPEDASFDAGTMLAVRGDIAALQQEIRNFPGVTLANWNSNNQVVIAGSRAELAEAQKMLVEKGFSAAALPVSAAFHTPLVAHAHKPFEKTVRKTVFNPPAVRVYSNTSGREFGSDPQQIQQTLADHILNPVRFKDEIEAIYADGGRVFIEFGPKNVLTGLVKNILEGKPHFAVALNASPKKDSDRQFREAVAQLCVLGLDLRLFDPYAARPGTAAAGKKSAVSVKLNGGLYLTEKTRTAFEKAAAEKNTLSQLKNLASQPERGQPPADAPAPALPSANPEGFGQAVRQMQEVQSEAVKAHSQFLANGAEYARIFGQLTGQELSLLAAGTSPAALEQINAALQTLDASMARFHEHQAETLRIHEQFLRSQSELSASLAVFSGSAPARAVLPGSPLPAPVVLPAPAQTLPPVYTPAAAGQGVPPNGNGRSKTSPADSAAAPVRPSTSEPAAPAQDAKAAGAKGLTAALLDIISDKTGYPAEMLDTGMDLEADLGIDSIKRVEILGAMQARFPELPKADSTALAEMRTLAQIVAFMAASSAGETAPAAPAGDAQAADAAREQPAARVAGLSVETVRDALVAIVSEKTGYPVEMLDPGMDLEADLGIDSIKRVEILGAVQARFPELPKADSTALAEMRTLEQIIDSMSMPSPGAPAPAASSAPAESEPALTNSLEVQPATPAAKPGAETIRQTLIEIVSEKTGYPAEMLDPGMDLEADLGIDSIKRVEILGAVQARFPELPKADSTALAEMRTLEQITLYLDEGSGTAGDAFAVQSSGREAGAGLAGLPRGVAALKQIPSPDRLDVSVPQGSICLVTDDGTRLTACLAEQLASNGSQVVVLRLPADLVSGSMPLPQGIRSVRIDDPGEVGLQAALEGVQQAYGPAAVYIHLDPPAAASEAFTEKEKTIVKTTFLAAKYLKESLNRAALSGHAAFLTVTRLDGQLGLDAAGTADPVSGGLFGLVKTLNLEWNGVFCRAVDLHPEIDAETAAGYIAAELFDPNRLISEICYNPQGRFTLVVAPVEEPA